MWGKNNSFPKIRSYGPRRTRAPLLIAEGVHARKTGGGLGRASIRLTMGTYGHLFEGSDSESAERMDRMFVGSNADSKTASNVGVVPGEKRCVRTKALRGKCRSL